LDNLYNSNKIVASVSIDHENIKLLDTIIDKITKQEAKINEFCINIPDKLKEFVSIDENRFNKYENIKIHYLKRDFKKCNSLIPPYLREKNGKTIFVVFDNNILKYLDDTKFITKLLYQYSLEGENTIITTNYNKKDNENIKGTFISNINNFDTKLVELSNDCNELINPEKWYKSNIIKNIKLAKYKF
jgi:hypothetical protein